MSSSIHLPPTDASKMGKTGDVPTWAVEPLDEAAGDWVGHGRKDDRDRLRAVGSDQLFEAGSGSR
jgi:hypothetical protein